MPTLTPVDYDPFAATPAAAPPSGGGTLTPVDYDPFAPQTTILGEIAEVGRGIPAGAVEAAGTALRGISANQPTERFASYLDEIEQGVRYRTREREGRLPITDDQAYTDILGRIADDPGMFQSQQLWLRNAIEKARAGDPSGVAEARARLPSPSVQDRDLWRAGEAVSEFAREHFAAKPGYEDTLGRAVGEGLGSLGAGLATAIVPGVGAGLSTTFFTAMGMGEAADRAVAAGATDEQIIQAAGYGAGPGATDIIPAEMLLGRIPGANVIAQAAKRFGGKRVMQALGRIGNQAIVESVQEGGQQVLQNLIAREVHSPETQALEGVVENSGIGGIVGGIAGLGREGVHAIAGRRSRSARGERARAVREVPPPSPEDEASPIATANIVEGRERIADSQATENANKWLAASGLPQVGQPIRVTRGRETMEGVVTDAWQGDDPGITVEAPDGELLDATLAELQTMGAELQTLPMPAPRAEIEKAARDIASDAEQVRQAAAQAAQETGGAPTPERRREIDQIMADVRAEAAGREAPAPPPETPALPRLTRAQGDEVARLIASGVPGAEAVAQVQRGAQSGTAPVDETATGFGDEAMRPGRPPEGFGTTVPPDTARRPHRAPGERLPASEMTERRALAESIAAATGQDVNQSRAMAEAVTELTGGDIDRRRALAEAIHAATGQEITERRALAEAIAGATGRDIDEARALAEAVSEATGRDVDSRRALAEAIAASSGRDIDERRGLARDVAASTGRDIDQRRAEALQADDHRQTLMFTALPRKPSIKELSQASQDVGVPVQTADQMAEQVSDALRTGREDVTPTPDMVAREVKATGLPADFADRIAQLVAERQGMLPEPLGERQERAPREATRIADRTDRPAAPPPAREPRRIPEREEPEQREVRRLPEGFADDVAARVAAVPEVQGLPEGSRERVAQAVADAMERVEGLPERDPVSIAERIEALPEVQTIPPETRRRMAAAAAVEVTRSPGLPERTGPAPEAPTLRRLPEDFGERIAERVEAIPEIQTLSPNRRERVVNQVRQLPADFGATPETAEPRELPPGFAERMAERVSALPEIRALPPRTRERVAEEVRRLPDDFGARVDERGEEARAGAAAQPTIPERSPAGPDESAALPASRGQVERTEGEGVVPAGTLDPAGTPTPPPPPITPAGEAIEAAEAETETQPTEGQKEAGNYRKGKFTLHGMEIAVENPKGSERSGVDRDGKPWSVTMPATYGYIRRTEGADGDQVDVYVGPEPESEEVFVVDQVDADTRAFDEHKVMMGYPSEDAALADYDAAFNDGRGPERRGAVTPMSLQGFRNWLDNGDTKKPVNRELAGPSGPPTRPRIVRRKDGEPFKTRQGAVLAARSQKIEGEPVEVEGGWAIETAMERAGEAMPAEPATGAPERATEAEIPATPPAEAATSEQETARAAPPPPVMRNDGSPFKTRQGAALAARSKKLEGAEPVEVEGGWAIQPAMPAEPAPMPEPSAAPEPDAPPVETATPENPEAPVPVAEGLYEFTPADLSTDAKAFQYKSGGDESGVTERLQGVQKWDQLKAGIAIVYERRDGTRVIADGHQRLGLAKRMAAEGQDPRILGRLVREVDGYTVEDVREMAALKNIAEGTGDAFDAATVLRDSSDPQEALSALPPQSSLVRNAKDIARLEQGPFRAAKAAGLPAGTVGVVGRVAEGDAPLQQALIEEFSARPPPNVAQAEAMARMFREDRTANVQVADLFGESEVATSLYRERARIIDGAIRRLKSDKRVFGTLAKNAEQIQAAGNVLAADNEALADAAGRGAYLVQQLATRTGPVADAVKAAAQRVSDGESYQTATTAVVEAIRQWASTESGALGAAGLERGAPDEGGRQPREPVPEREDEARRDDEVDPDEVVVLPGQGAMFQRAPGPVLRATHGLSINNLRSAVERGTLVAPSVAVTPAEVPHQWGGPGNVEVVFKANAIDPKRWGITEGDAWTPTHPKVERIIKSHAAQRRAEAAVQRDFDAVEQRLRDAMPGYAKEAVEDGAGRVPFDSDGTIGEHRRGETDSVLTAIHLQEQGRTDISEDEFRKVSYSPEFERWKAGYLKSLPGVEEVIFAGYTASGRRRYLPATTQNVLKDMKRQAREAGEAVSFGGHGEIWARWRPQVRTKGQMREAAARVTRDEGAYEAQKKEITDEILDIGRQIAQAVGRTGAMDFDTGLNILLEAGPNEARLNRVASEYSFDGEPVELPSHLIDEIREHFDKVAEMPLQFLEAKRIAEVPMSDVAAVVVPKGAFPKSLRTKLEDQGIEVREKREGMTDEELAEVQSIPSALFKRAWHASPHRFDKFSTESIGTGEGAQVYGWGLYFADKKSVAEWYQSSFEGRQPASAVRYEGKEYPVAEDGGAAAAAAVVESVGGAPPVAREVGERVAANDHPLRHNLDLGSRIGGALQTMADEQRQRNKARYRAEAPGYATLDDAYHIVAQMEETPDDGISADGSSYVGIGTRAAWIKAGLSEEAVERAFRETDRENLYRIDMLDQLMAARGRAAYDAHDIAAEWRALNDLRDKARTASTGVEVVKTDKAPLYRVELAPKDDEYLLWDERFAKQPGGVKKAVRAAMLRQPERIGARPDADPSDWWGVQLDEGAMGFLRLPKPGDLFVFRQAKDGSLEWAAVPRESTDYDWWIKDRDTGGSGNGRQMLRAFEDAVEAQLSRLTGEQLYHAIARNNEGERGASEVLLAQGVRGNKYLDGSSRSRGEGSYNYVIFDDSDVAIEEIMLQRRRAAGVADPKSPEFQRWFGDSKVVNARGEPQPVFHASSSPERFERFDPERMGENYADNAGFFFTSDPGSAEGFGNRVSEGYLSIQNPLVLEAGRDDPTEFWFTNRGAFTQQMIEGGHDGVIVRGDEFVDERGQPLGEFNDMYIATDPSQIRSAEPDAKWRRGGQPARQDAAPPQVRIVLAKRFDAEKARIADDIKLAGRETFGERFQVELAESITPPDGSDATGAFSPANRIAYIALRADQDGMTGALWHEGLHYLRQAGAFSRADGSPSQAWQTLESQAVAQWRKDYGIDERYGPDVEGMDADQRERLLNEEAIAEALADYAVRGRETGFKATVRATFNRILRFFRAVRAGLQGRGFETWEDVFEGIERGEAGRRADAAQPQPLTPAQAEAFRERAAQFEFNFDAPVVVPAGRDAGAVRSEPARRVERLTETRLVSLESARVGVTRIQTPQDAAHVFAPFRKEPTESLVAAAVDADGKVLGLVRHSVGTTASAPIELGVLTGSVMQIPGAKGFWVSHQHPSGVTVPSQADQAVAQRIAGLTEDTGLKYHGAFVVAPGQTKAMFMPPSKMRAVPTKEVDIRPAPRRAKVPVFTRRWRKVAPSEDRPQVSNYQQANEVAREYLPEHSGLLLLDSKSHLVGAMTMGPSEMADMRRSGTARDLMRAIAETNATSAVGMLPAAPESFDAARNMLRFGRDIGQDGGFIVHAIHEVAPDGKMVRAHSRDLVSAAGMDRYLQVAWHGSPHRFDKFSTEAIGSGEGAQVYGFGLYFADRKKVADWYRSALATPTPTLMRDGEPVSWSAREGDVRSDVGYALTRERNRAQGVGEQPSTQQLAMALRADARTEMDLEDGNPAVAQALGRIADGLMDGTYDVRWSEGATYRVNLAPKDSEYLYWDRRLDLHPKKVRRAVEAVWERSHPGERLNRQETGGELYNMLASEFGTPGTAEAQRAASEALLAEGVRGIKYLDQSSRPLVGAMGRARMPARETFNYVIFDDSDVAIEEIMLQRQRAGDLFDDPRQTELPGTERLDDRGVEAAKARDREQSQEMVEDVFGAETVRRSDKLRSSKPQEGVEGFGLFDRQQTLFQRGDRRSAEIAGSDVYMAPRGAPARQSPEQSSAPSGTAEPAGRVRPSRSGVKRQDESAPSEQTLLQRGKATPKANKEEFDKAATDWSGVDLTGAADEVIKDKDRMGGFAESVKAGLKGTTAIQDPKVQVTEEKTHKDLNLAWRYLAPPLAWSKKFPAIHELIKQGVKTEKEMSIFIQRLNREWDRITKKLNKDEFGQLTGILFLGDAEQVTFTDEQLERFDTTAKVRAAYRQSRRYLDKLGRYTEQHERAMALPLMKRRTKLVHQMAGERGMDKSAFRSLYNARAELMTKLRTSKVDPRVVNFQIAEATEALYGGPEAPSEVFADRLKEVDKLEQRIADTKVRRREGYVPHKFFGRWRIFQKALPDDEIEPYMGRGGTGFKDRKAAEKVAEASEGGLLDGATPIEVDGKWGLQPKWKEVAGEHGLWKTRTDAVRAASHIARETPDAEIMVLPVEFVFPEDQATTLSDAGYWRFRSNVEKLTGLTGEALQEVVTGAARRPFRRRIAGFLQYRTGMTGYSLDLDRVMRTHVGETVRYASLDQLKFDAINTMEKEGLSSYYSAIQDRPVLAAAVQAWFRDVNGQKQQLESQIDSVLNKSWVTPLRAGLAAGALGFLASGGPFNAPISPIVGAYVGYRVGRGLAQGGDFATRSITGSMLGDMAHLKLGAVFNLMSALVNTSQIPLNTLPVLGARDTFEGTVRYQKAVLSKLRGKPNADWRFLERMDINPLDTFAEGTRHKFKKESKLSKMSMVFFSTAEGFNRGTTALGALNKAQRKGWSHTKAKEYANETMDRTQFHYGASDKPELLRNTLLRVPLQFKNFVAHQLTFVFGLKRKELPIFLLSMALTAGALGIPGLDFVDTLTDWLFDFSPIAAMKGAALDAAVEGELAGGIATLLTRGVPGLAGVDMTGRVGMGDKFLPMQFRDWKGPWISTVENAVRHGKEGASWQHQMRNLSPGLGNPLVVLDAWQNGGQMTSPWKRGRPEYRATETELIQKLVGARPIREARLQDLRDIERRNIEDYRVDTRRYVDRIVAALDRGDRVEARTIMQEALDNGVPISSGSIRRAIQDMGTQRALREFDRLPRTMKPEGMARRQAIERQVAQ